MSLEVIHHIEKLGVEVTKVLDTIFLRWAAKNHSDLRDISKIIDTVYIGCFNKKSIEERFGVI
ncbi:hypothetical protein DRF58_09135 [Epilithonimonas hispanica]|uniref:Uncharacterized protein n=1 Tax=Epilithonimonas hispanica TaxID=358687 RepID=A0A3D9CXZ1_9FLAO|nr:hypothetical protein DRF58_09135 [Epilithonimonas hispanica]